MSNQNLKPSDDLKKYTRYREALKLIAYPDPGSRDGTPWTIGYGHTKGVRRGMTCTEAQAESWLTQDLEAAAATVRKLVTVSLTQGQFDALTDFAYNVGEPQFSTSTLLRKVNTLQFGQAAQQFERWIYQDGKKLLGLKRRRVAERALFEGRSVEEAIKLGESIKSL